MGEDLPKKLDDLPEELEKIKDKVKLVGLEIDKKSADLEIKIGKVDERFKEVAYGFPKLRDRADEIENLLHVINLGLVDFKGNFADIDSRMSKLEEMPGGIERRIVDLDAKLKKLDEDVKKIYLRLDEIGMIKQDVTNALEGKINSNSENMRKETADNKAEIEHLKKNLDALNFAIKSFERTVELTNLDDIIKRFDSIDRRILTIQTELDSMRSSGRDSSEIGRDVEVLKKRFKQMIPTIMDALNRINRFEVKVDSKLARVEGLEKSVMELNTDRSNTAAERIEEMNEIKKSMEDLYGEMKRIYDSSDVKRDRLEKTMQELEELDKFKSDLEEVRKAVIENRSKIKSLKR